MSRDLEEDEIVVVGKFERALRFSRERKNVVAERDILYNLAWYYHWWLNNEINFEKFYVKYQNEVIKDKEIEEILKLANLWTLAYTRKNRSVEDVKDKTDILLKLLEKKEKSQSRVTQLEAKTRICIIKILLEEDITKQFSNLVEIVEEATKFKEYDFLVLAKMIENMLPIFSENEKYNELYELITEKLTARKGEIQKDECHGNKEKVDELISDFYKNTVIKKLPSPLYINGKESKLLHRFSEFILALLENTFATMYSYKTYMRGDIIIKILIIL